MKSYSVAIRTLGTNPDMLRSELESVYAQTHRPDKVVIYIAEGYAIPDFRVGGESYVTVKKGMLTQRANDYSEIDTELILFLDDDVYLAPDSASRLIKALEDGGYDCVAPDTFRNQEMGFKSKIYSFFTNLTLAIPNCRYAYKVHYNGTLSFLSNPEKGGIYPTQSASGPCSLWRKDAFLAIDMESEKWIDTLRFAYSEDQLTHYKLYANGGRLAMYYDCGVEHRDGRAARGKAYKSAEIFATRAQAQYIVWHRSLFNCEKSKTKKALKALSVGFKLLWLLPVHIAAAVGYRNVKVPYYFVKGTIDGIKFTRSDSYKGLRPYILK